MRALERFCHSNPAVLFVRVPEHNTSRVWSRCWQLRPKQAGFRVELVFDWGTLAGVAIMAVLLGLFFYGHHRGAQASTPGAPP